MAATSQANSDTTFCPEFENSVTQSSNNSLSSKPAKAKRRKKFSQDISILQKQTCYSLNSYKKNSESVSTIALENHKNDILNIIKGDGLHSKSLTAFKKKLILIDEALKERQQTEISKSQPLNNPNSLLLLEENEIEIPDSSVETTNKQLDTIQSVNDEPINLCLRNLVNSYNNSELIVNNEVVDLNLQKDNEEFCSPIDLSLKRTDKNLSILNIQNEIKEKNDNLKLNILQNPDTTKKINYVIRDEKSENILRNPRSPLKITDINQSDKETPITSVSLNNNQNSSNKLSEADLEIIKEQLKAKINKYFAEHLNEENPIQYNSEISSNKNIDRSQTNDLFENLWSKSIESPSNIQPINYNDLKEIIEQQSLSQSEGTDTNHIDVDLSIQSPLANSLYQKNIKSNDQSSMSTINNYTPEKIQRVSEQPIYSLSDKHILRLASVLNLNVDYLKSQIKFCLTEYSRDNYDFDDISVIAPSQSPINYHKIRQMNRNPLKIYENFNISKTISHFDIYRNQNYNISHKLKNKLKKRQSKNKNCNIFSNFSKR